MAKDADYRRLIHTARWVKLRRQTLTEHPLCMRCLQEQYVTPATEVHHIHPVEYGINLAQKERLMFSPTNLVALCHRCHVRIHTELGRSGRAAQRRRNDEQVAAVRARFFED